MTDKAQAALRRIVDTINSTGGIVKHADETHGCLADPDWIDLADAYLLACEALNIAPLESTFKEALE
jgi:hypothetical protein